MGILRRSISLCLALTLILTLLPTELVIGEKNVENNKIHIETTYPDKNKKEVEVNPIIQFKFKEKVELMPGYNKKIKITSDAGKFAVNLEKDAFVSFEGNTLKIDINSMDKSGKFYLRKDTAYKVTLEKGTLKLSGKKDKWGRDILNDEENLYFITGKDKLPSNMGIVVNKYSSNILGTDSIERINSTQLETDGEIFIHFNKNIQWNKYTENVKTDEQALVHFRLYKKPKEYKKDTYLYDIDKLSVPRDGESVGIESVQIIKDNLGQNTNILKIKPKDKLLNLNQYLISCEKNVLMSFEDDLLKDGISKNIWTKPSNDKTTPNWDRNSSAEDIKEDKNAPNIDKSADTNYVIHGAPNYDENTPITILVDKEVVLKPYEDSRSPLWDIELYECFERSNKYENLKVIEKYEIEHYFENGIKKTKILLYPKEQLESGKEYKLEIKSGTFVTRGNMPLDSVNLRFVIEGDYTEEAGIYGAKVLVDGSPQTNEIFDDYLYFKYENKDEDIEKDKEKDKNERELNHQMSFELYGYNFSEEIESVKLVKVKEYQPIDEGERGFYWDKIINEIPKTENFISKDKYVLGYTTKKDHILGVDGREYHKDSVIYQNTITLPTKDLKFESVNKITGKFDRETMLELSKASSLGEYDVEITFKEPEQMTRIKKVAKLRRNALKISNKLRPCNKKPKHVDHSPKVDADVNLGIVTISFEDIHCDVKSRLNILGTDGFSVTDVETGFELIEDKNRIKSTQKSRTGKIIFEIPIKTSELREGKTYRVTIPGDIARCKHNYDLHSNEPKIWTFKVSSTPKVQKIYEGSVPEEYDASYPIMIEGTNIKRGVTVRFKNMDTGKIYSTENSNTFVAPDKLLVYLPKTNKLPVGRYNIIVINEFNQKDEYSDYVFSVVRKGKYVPNEQFRMKDIIVYDEKVEVSIKEIIKTSKNELNLESINHNQDLDLDLIIGEDVLTRELKYDSSYISLLDTKSKWSDIKLIGLKSKAIGQPMTIRLGRAEPEIRDNLKKKLKGKNIKSDFIIVGGNNYTVEKLNLSIPYRQSSGNKLKVLRYDEETRRINEIKVLDRNINKIDKKVNIELANALPSDRVNQGIFVVVEY